MYPSVAHSLALPLGPALLNLWTVIMMIPRFRFGFRWCNILTFLLLQIALFCENFRNTHISFIVGLLRKLWKQCLQGYQFSCNCRNSYNLIDFPDCRTNVTINFQAFSCKIVVDYCHPCVCIRFLFLKKKNKKTIFIDLQISTT